MARFYLKTPVGRSGLGSGTTTGRFAIDIPCSAQILIIESPGYRAQTLRLNLSAPATGQDLVEVIIPLVAVDPLERDKPYLQSEQTHVEQANADNAVGQYQRNTFTTIDALTGKAIAAQACFFYTKTGQKRCLDADATGRFSLDFREKDIVAMEVTAPGYQTYQGNIIVDELDGRRLHHTVRLLRELTLLSVQLDEPAEIVELRARSAEVPTSLIRVPGSRHTMTAHGLLAQPYTLTIYDQQRTVREQRPFVIRPGLNVLRLRAADVETPLTRPMPTVSFVNPDSLPLLYFEQGSFTLRPGSKSVLVQTAAYLHAHPDFTLQLIGHADREGDERLNRALSENRAKVVSSFLFEHGVPDERMQRMGHGSRFLLAPSDTEENKAKNRRVQMKLIQRRR